jgi:hypothetical protein
VGLECGFPRDPNVTGVILWGVNRIAVLKFRILERLQKTALVATLGAVGKLGSDSSARTDVLYTQEKFISGKAIGTQPRRDQTKFSRYRIYIYIYIYIYMYKERLTAEPSYCEVKYNM